jgi:hypothetical protein
MSRIASGRKGLKRSPGISPGDFNEKEKHEQENKHDRQEADQEHADGFNTFEHEEGTNSQGPVEVKTGQ